MNNLWVLAIGVALLGGLGSVLRFALASWQRSLPWGILAANTAASIVVGFAAAMNLFGHSQNLVLSTVLATGFAGGLSTFSSWAAQTVALLARGRRLQGYLNVLLNMVLPVSGAIAGLILGASLLK